MTTTGEYVVGGYLKHILGCDVVDYNVRPPGGGIEGQSEFDVIGLSFAANVAYMCEVTTHLNGLHYSGGNAASATRIENKFQRQQKYAQKHLTQFNSTRFMFWSPVVPHGYLTEKLCALDGLQLVINERYKECVEELSSFAETSTHDTGNPFIRSLQILTHLRS